MAVYDYRTKPNTQWTFYVVDHLPTMSNLYRFDTVQEAIDKFKSLSPNQRSAIGSSLLSHYEIDHIHKIDGKAVLIRDMDHMSKPLWRESSEITEAVAAMRDQLRVEFEKSFLFGSQRGGVAVPVMDGEPKLSSHLKDKQLNPKVFDRPLSGINEVFIEGKGWTDILKFLDDMDKREWSQETGYPVPFVTTINIRYRKQSGRTGQIDINPSDFSILKKDYERSLERKPGLDEKISDAGAKAAGQTHKGKGKGHNDRSI